MSSAKQWESGEFGRDEKHVRRSSKESEDAVDKALGITRYKALCLDAVAVMEDINSWLIRTDRENTAHQMHLAAFIARARLILKADRSD